LPSKFKKTPTLKISKTNFREVKFAYIALSAIFFMVGVVVFLIQRDILIFQWPFSGSNSSVNLSSNIASVFKKEINLFYWKDEKWFCEKLLVLWNKKNNPENIKQLVNGWVNLAKDEKIVDQNVCIETVALSQYEDLFLSFNQSFLPKNISIREKWLLVEGILKTIRGSRIQLSFVLFLEKQKMLQDDHLDFSQSWPLSGYL
jgi:hypothetical protein